ncbi:MAG: rRNA pseudouridine synthase [Oscillospiraceae bacterium]|nr:rRNA pseudouridine synthase [Oscillospiraceae bacterium]
MTERLQKILASRGVTSRRKAEEMIRAGRVTCNGRVCLLGESADPDSDIILLDGKPLPSGGDNMYILLHKPRGFVTTLSDEKGRKNVTQLVADCGQRVYPVGRLDMDSEGLLILTNDGEFANRVMHPRHTINKTYRVQVKGYTSQGLEKLSQPVTLDGYTIARPDVRLLSADEKGNAWIEVVIHEGRNRQVRRMCDLAGMSVIRLIRVAEGGVELGTLPLGKWRHLTDAEIEKLIGVTQ